MRAYGGNEHMHSGMGPLGNVFPFGLLGPCHQQAYASNESANAMFTRCPNQRLLDTKGYEANDRYQRDVIYIRTSCYGHFDVRHSLAIRMMTAHMPSAPLE